MDYVDGPEPAGGCEAGVIFAEAALARLRADCRRGQFITPINQGVLHRGMKPSNVLLGPGESADDHRFRPGQRVLTSDTKLTLSGQVLGTPGYLPPEQASGRRRGGGGSLGSDVYGLGALLYLPADEPVRLSRLQEVTDVLRTGPQPQNRSRPGC